MPSECVLPLQTTSDWPPSDAPQPDTFLLVGKELAEGTPATLLKCHYGTLTIEQNGRQWQISQL
ncbi:MAG: hypothetical protein H0X66_04810 [Verrucomicrobia bacterium]|nr:hypothetical protein [Verrucomicrobiota bacterium]